MKKLILMSSIAAIALTGCLGDKSEDERSNRFTLSVTDAPVLNAAKVVIAFDKVEVKHSESSSQVIEISDGDSDYWAIDLMTLQGSESEQLISTELEPGEYNWVRLHIVTTEGASYVELDDETRHDLTVPSGSTSGLKLNQGFTMPSFGNADFTLDIDLSKSLVVNGNGEYHLKPVIRMVDNLEVGHINGSLSQAFMDENGCTGAVGAIYLFDGSNTEFDDLGSANEPLTTALLEHNATDDTYAFEIGFVPAGDYTAHVVCNLDSNNVDDPEIDDEVVATDSSNVSVTVDTTVTVSFED